MGCIGTNHNGSWLHLDTCLKYKQQHPRINESLLSIGIFDHRNPSFDVSSREFGNHLFWKDQVYPTLACTASIIYHPPSIILSSYHHTIIILNILTSIQRAVPLGFGPMTLVTSKDGATLETGLGGLAAGLVSGASPRHVGTSMGIRAESQRPCFVYICLSMFIFSKLGCIHIVAHKFPHHESLPITFSNLKLISPVFAAYFGAPDVHPKHSSSVASLMGRRVGDPPQETSAASNLLSGSNGSMAR